MKISELLATLLKTLLVILAVGALLSADLLTVQVTQGLLHNGGWKDALAIALLAIALVSAAAAVFVPFRPKLEELWKWLSIKKLWLRLPEIDDNLRRNSLSFSRILSFCLFITVAGITSYFAWKHLRQGDPDSKVVIGLLTSTLVALLFALLGSELIRSVRKVGPSGIEFGVWQEIARIPDTNYLEDEYYDITVDPLEEGEFSGEQRWKYERAMGHYIHLAHRGVDIHGLEGADLRSYRRLILWLGKRTLRRSQFQKALDILKPLDHLSDVTYDELLALALSHWYLAIELYRPEDSKGMVVDIAQDDEFHYGEAKRLLERAITSPNHEARAHWVLAYAYDELGVYGQAIKQNLLAIQMDPVRFRTLGYWNIAVSRLNQGKPARAITALRRIKSDDKYWQEIWEDAELEELRKDPKHGPEFDELYRKSLWERDWGWVWVSRS